MLIKMRRIKYTLRMRCAASEAKVETIHRKVERFLGKQGAWNLLAKLLEKVESRERKVESSTAKVETF